MPRPCGVRTKNGYCWNAPDKETGDGFCVEHAGEWRRSAELREAIKDPGVAVAAGLRAPRGLSDALKPFKKKWLTRLEKELDAEELEP